MAVASVVIPAHNEATSIGRNLAALRAGGDDLEVVLVCNGCTDDTADRARAADPAARVIEIAQPSKAAAVRVGNSATSVFPRVHLDADIELSGSAVHALLAPLGHPPSAAGGAGTGVLATAPVRSLRRAGCSRFVRWFYDVWEELPAVQGGLFGRGVVALSEEAQQRLATLPQLMSDDLAMSDSFAPDERLVVERAVAVIHPPKTVADLVRRRIRVVTGNVQAGRAGIRRDDSRTTPRDVLDLARRRPALVPKIPVFVGVHVVAKVGARRAVKAGDFTTWQRDESSRGPGPEQLR